MVLSGGLVVYGNKMEQVNPRPVKSQLERDRTEEACRLAEEASKHPDKFIVCITGGRQFSRKDRVYEALDKLHTIKPITAFIHGDAEGADTFGKEWALERLIPIIPFPAEWTNYAMGAGPIRNLAMLNYGKPDMVVAFPGGRGTLNMVGYSEKRAKFGGKLKVWKPYADSFYKAYWDSTYKEKS